MEKREVPNLRGLDELRGSDPDTHRAAKRPRRDAGSEPSAYWQDEPPKTRWLSVSVLFVLSIKSLEELPWSCFIQ